MPYDALSDVLRAVRLKGAVFFDVDAGAPWAAEAPAACVVGPSIMPGVDHVIEYHVVAHGECYATLLAGRGDVVRLKAGDVVAFPQGDTHVVSSHPGMRAEPDIEAHCAPGATGGLPVPIRIGEGDDRTHVICGFLGCDVRPFNPLISAMPRMIHLPGNGGEAWMKRFLDFAKLESEMKRAGGASMLARLGEIMFIDLVRRHIEGLDANQPSWLAGLKDRQIGLALSLLHEAPGDAWTIERLARDCGMSRSTLSERFAHFVGRPPMQYLTLWRMQLAAQMLLAGEELLAEIAARVGYESEAAFSRAFKRTVGAAPGEWRDARLTAP